MSRRYWIDSVRDETWLPGLRAANLLLRAGQPVGLASHAPPGAPYLALLDPHSAIIRWLEEQEVAAGEDPARDSEDLVELHAPRVAMFGGAGSPYCHASAFAALGVAWFYVTGAEIAAGALDEADVLVVPGGGWYFGNAQLQDMGVAGTDAVLRFIDAGGGYLSSCAGSTIAMRSPAHATELWHPTKTAFTLLNVDNWERLINADGGYRSPGIGRIKTRLAEPRHPVALGLPTELDVTHYNGPIFREPAGDAEVVIRYAGVTDQFTPSECFFGHDGRPADAERSHSDMAEAGTLGLPGIVAGKRGDGRVVLAGLHPEFGLSESLADWERPVQLIGNAVLWLAQRGRGVSVAPTVPDADPVQAETDLMQALDAAKVAIERLRAADRNADTSWLSDEAHRASFGLTPAELWQQALETFPALIEGIATAWNEARQMADPDQAKRLAAAALDHFAPEGGADLGAQGAIWLVEEATRLIDDASSALEEGGAAQIRAEIRVSRSYLSALGVMTNAEQRLRTEAETYAAEAELARLNALVGAELAVAG